MIFDNWYRFQNYAKDNGYDRLEFSLFTADGFKKCKWLDAYMGLFTLEGVNGFLMVRDADEHMPNPTILVDEKEDEAA